MLAEVPAGDVVGICRARIKAEAEALEPGAGRPLAAALQALAAVRDEAEAEGTEPAQLDPRGDLKVADIDAVTALLERSALVARRAALRPHRCPQLSEQFALVRSQALLEARCCCRFARGALRCAGFRVLPPRRFLALSLAPAPASSSASNTLKTQHTLTQPLSPASKP